MESVPTSSPFKRVYIFVPKVIATSYRIKPFSLRKNFPNNLDNTSTDKALKINIKRLLSIFRMGNDRLSMKGTQVVWLTLFING